MMQRLSMRARTISACMGSSMRLATGVAGTPTLAAHPTHRVQASTSVTSLAWGKEVRLRRGAAIGTRSLGQIALPRHQFSTADGESAITKLTDVGIFSDPGCKQGNEDRFVVGHIGPFHIIGVFDGHSGSMAADYAADNLLWEAGSLIEKNANAGHEPERVLRDLVRRLCDGLYRHMEGVMPVEKMHSGTTASIVLLDDSRVTYAHVGDSRILLARGGGPVQLTRDHRLDDDEERQRILDAGGRVTYTGIPRVNGQLAMTRAIGAFALRDQGVTCEPDVGTVPLDAGVDNALILATDGLFDELRNDEVVAVVAQHDTPSSAAAALGETALMYRARDNVTVAVVPLPAWQSLHNPKAGTPFGFDRHLVRRAS